MSKSRASAARRNALRHRERVGRKYLNKIMRVHWAYATIINPKWSARQLFMGICERLPDKHLEWIINNPKMGYGDLSQFAQEEMIEREQFGKTRTDFDDAVIAELNIADVRKALTPKGINNMLSSWRKLHVQDSTTFSADSTSF